MRLVVAGTPEPAVPALEALLASNHDVAAVITRPDARAGRGHALTPSPVGRVASEAGLEVLKPESPRDASFLEHLRGHAPDACPIVAYGALLRPDILAIPRYGWINLHFSLLPAWRGAAPVQHALLHGDDVVGASTFRVEEGMDTGPVYGVVTESVAPTDTSGDLVGRLAVSGAQLLVRTLDGIESGHLQPRPQPSDGVSYAPKLTPEDARVDWSEPSVQIDRRIRACTPAPGAWTTFRGERLKLGPVSAVLDEADLAPGQLHAQRDRVLTGTGTRTVELGVVQPRGKRWMPAPDWAHGIRVTADDRLE